MQAAATETAAAATTTAAVVRSFGLAVLGPVGAIRVVGDGRREGIWDADTRRRHVRVWVWAMERVGEAGRRGGLLRLYWLFVAGLWEAP